MMYPSVKRGRPPGGTGRKRGRPPSSNVGPRMTTPKPLEIAQMYWRSLIPRGAPPLSAAFLNYQTEMIKQFNMQRELGKLPPHMGLLGTTQSSLPPFELPGSSVAMSSTFTSSASTNKTLCQPSASVVTSAPMPTPPSAPDSSAASISAPILKDRPNLSITPVRPAASSSPKSTSTPISVSVSKFPTATKPQVTKRALSPLVQPSNVQTKSSHSTSSLRSQLTLSQTTSAPSKNPMSVITQSSALSISPIPPNTSQQKKPPPPPPPPPSTLGPTLSITPKVPPVPSSTIFAPYSDLQKIPPAHSLAPTTQTYSSPKTTTLPPLYSTTHSNPVPAPPAPAKELSLQHKILSAKKLNQNSKRKPEPQPETIIPPSPPKLPKLSLGSSFEKSFVEKFSSLLAQAPPAHSALHHSSQKHPEPIHNPQPPVSASLFKDHIPDSLTILPAHSSKQDIFPPISQQPPLLSMASSASLPFPTASFPSSSSRYPPSSAAPMPPAPLPSHSHLESHPRRKLINDVVKLDSSVAEVIKGFGNNITITTTSPPKPSQQPPSILQQRYPDLHFSTSTSSQGGGGGASSRRQHHHRHHHQEDEPKKKKHQPSCDVIHIDP